MLCFMIKETYVYNFFFSQSNKFFENNNNAMEAIKEMDSWQRFRKIIISRFIIL